jgi:hypothetical protein
MPSHAPLESTAESGDFLIHLLDKWAGDSWLLETAVPTPNVANTVALYAAKQEIRVQNALSRVVWIRTSY